LEAAEIKLIKQAAKARAKAIKKGTAPDDETWGDVDGESGSVAARWVQPKQRPTHRLKFLIGKKVDTINWCRSELERLVPQIDALQATYRAGEADFVCSVFIEFYTQTEAQAAFQSLAHHQALHMAPRFIGVDPEQIIWKNLKINWASRVIRNIITTLLVVLLIIFWSIPVGFVGIISNIKSLQEKAPFLKFLDKIPPSILGVIQGLLPAVLLAVLMALLPIILRLMAKKGGCPSLATIELRTQSYYFLFQVIQVFLVTTFTSAASAVGAKIAKEPAKTPELLASNLPHASNFFLSYLIVQGLTVSAGALAQVIGIIVFRILGKILDNTPRKMYKRFTTLAGLGWGTVFPIYTNLCVIGQ
jgi:calcium permeable stress-gated cation channel